MPASTPQSGTVQVGVSTGTGRQAFQEVSVQTQGGVLTGTGGAEETILVAGAISLTSSVTKLSAASGAYAVTLAAPSVAGLTKVITMTVAGNAITLALSNCIGGTAATTASFDAVDEALTLVSGPNKWMIVGQVGVTLS